MLRRLNVLFSIALLVCSAAAYSAEPIDPPGRVARLNLINGPVSFAPYEAPDSWVQAVVNRPVTSGDRLWADQNGRAELHVGSTAIRLDAMTSADVLNLDDDVLQLRLAQGALNLRVRELDANDIVEVATPMGGVLLRQPGSYRVSVDPYGGTTRVLVNFGQAEVVTPSQTFAVPSSQAATINASGAPSFELAQYAPASEFDRWSSDRDRREDRSVSARYVSRDMTGYEDLDQYGTWRALPEYGNVWVPTRVASDWAPYRYGHWVWVSPWGWTWVDDAPWGYAPSHYGRWVYVDNYWAWAPGPVARRPVYAPALVAFVGGSSFSVSVRSGPAVGWFPLGWREPYIPWYRASHRHVQNVNVTQVTNVTNITNVTNVRYVNRDRPGAVTVVPQQAFVSSRPVARSAVPVTRNELTRAEILRERAPAEPIRASFAPERTGHRPPAQAVTREVVAVNPPASPTARETPSWRERPRGDDAAPRVQVLRRERDQDRERGQPPRAATAPGVVATPGAAGAPGVTAVPGSAAAPGAVTTTTPRFDPERATDRREQQRQERREAANERRERVPQAQSQSEVEARARAEAHARAQAEAQARQARAHAEARERAQQQHQQQRQQQQQQQQAQQAQARAQAQAQREERREERRDERREERRMQNSGNERPPAGPQTGTGSRRQTD
ncbi:MAG TPA: DUF6600 domain-containing protein [Burkholderiales bacterium]|nr:DUF6600 domain-containing protein [Burkholderiales bacterium]